jgi:hypothetical protein
MSRLAIASCLAAKSATICSRVIVAPGACLGNPNTLLVGRLRRQKNLPISNILRAERAY